MSFTAEFLLQVVISISAGAGVYAAIRADLATLHANTKHATESANTAHRRIDEIMTKHK